MKLSKVLLYSLTKYFELAVTALVVFHFAHNVGPVYFGEFSVYLLCITYSAFVVLGINSSYVKFYSIEREKENKGKLTAINFVFNCVMGIFVFVFVQVYFSIDGAFYLALICFMNLLRGSIQSILRASQRVNVLTAYNGLFAVIYLSMYMTFLVWNEYSIDNFLFSWSASLVTVNVIGLFFIRKDIFHKSNYSFEYFVSKTNVLATTSLNLFLVSICNTLLLSFDRVLFNFFGVDKAMIGNYQFADNIASVFYLGSNALLYMLSPYYMSELASDKITITYFKKKFLRIFLAWSVPLVFFVVISYLLLPLMFPEYSQSVDYVAGLTLNKYLCLLLFVPTTILSYLNDEKLLLISYIKVMPLLILIQFVIVGWTSTPIFLIPYISAMFIFILLFSLLKTVERS
ncbi:lipopolysaccharide biosynthesis protein [Vibrio breoganii]